jgi:hypothetical protein
VTPLIVHRVCIDAAANAAVAPQARAALERAGISIPRAAAAAEPPAPAPAPAPVAARAAGVYRPSAEQLAKEARAGHGAVTERYRWVQTLGDVTLSIQLPAGTAARDLRVSIETRRLRVELAAGAASEVVVDGVPGQMAPSGFYGDPYRVF